MLSYIASWWSGNDANKQDPEARKLQSWYRRIIFRRNKDADEDTRRLMKLRNCYYDKIYTIDKTLKNPFAE